MIKYKKAGLFLCLILALLLTGCSTGNKTGNGGPITLYWWVPKSEIQESALKQMAQDYMSQTSAVKVEVVTVDPRNYETEILRSLAAHKTVSNAPDVFSINVQDLPRFAPQLMPAPDNLFDSYQTGNQKTGKPTTQYVNDLYESVVSKSVILKDPSGNQKVYGLPIGLDTLSLFINTDTVQKSIQALKDKNKLQGGMSEEQVSALAKEMQSPPKTWAALSKIVPYLTLRDGDNITQSAIALGTGANVERSADILQTIMLQNGTQMTSTDQNSAAFNLATAQAGSASATTNTGLRALDFYLQFSNPQSSLYTWNNKMPNNVEAFEQGQLAMLIHYSDLYRYIITEAPSIKNSIDVQPLPQALDPASPLALTQVKSMARMNLEVASSVKGDTNRQKAAWDFIHYITGKQGSTTYLTNLKLTSALKDANGQPRFQAQSTQKSWSDLWYKGIEAQSVDEIFIAMIENSASGKKSSKDAIDQAAKDVSTILSGSKIKWPNASQGTNATNN